MCALRPQVHLPDEVRLTMLVFPALRRWLRACFAPPPPPPPVPSTGTPQPLRPRALQLAEAPSRQRAHDQQLGAALRNAALTHCLHVVVQGHHILTLRDTLRRASGAGAAAAAAAAASSLGAALGMGGGGGGGGGAVGSGAAASGAKFAKRFRSALGLYERCSLLCPDLSIMFRFTLRCRVCLSPTLFDKSGIDVEMEHVTAALVDAVGTLDALCELHPALLPVVAPYLRALLQHIAPRSAPLRVPPPQQPQQPQQRPPSEPPAPAAPHASDEEDEDSAAGGARRKTSPPPAPAAPPSAPSPATSSVRASDAGVPPPAAASGGTGSDGHEHTVLLVQVRVCVCRGVARPSECVFYLGSM